MGCKLARVMFLKCALVSTLLFNDLISIWILVRKTDLDDNFKDDNKPNPDNIHPILPPLYSMLSLLFSFIFGCPGIYYSSESLLAIYCILSVISVPISVLVMLRIKVYIHVIFNAIVCMLSLFLLHELKGFKTRDSNDLDSERSVINRNSYPSQYSGEEYSRMPRPPKYEEIVPQIRPPKYEEIFGKDSNRFVVTI